MITIMIIIMNIIMIIIIIIIIVIIIFITFCCQYNVGQLKWCSSLHPAYGVTDQEHR